MGASSARELFWTLGYLSGYGRSQTGKEFWWRALAGVRVNASSEWEWREQV